jgi:hypothetical protein
VDDPEARLVKLLRDAIDVVAAFSPLVPEPVAVSWPVPEPAPLDHRAPVRESSSYVG